MIDPGSWLNQGLIGFSLVAPILIAAALAARQFAKLPRLLDLAAFAAAPACIAALFLQPQLQQPEALLLGLHFGLDEVGQIFLRFTAILWLAAGLFARAYLHDDPRSPQFFMFFLLTMCGNLGLILAQDGLTFFVFYTLMSLSAYGLIIHDPKPEKLRAGRVYIALTLLGEVMLFAALALLAGPLATSSFFSLAEPVHSNAAAQILLTLGFGIKVGIVPLHVWLPLAHPAAPTPASAVLSGAMIKAGLLGWLRFLPLGSGDWVDFSNLFIGIGIITISYGVLVGMVQQNAKTILAYSSISQMGLLTLAIGFGLGHSVLWPTLLPAIIAYAAHHGFAKASLFLGLGILQHAGRRALVFLGLLFATLAMAGAPLTSGAIAKLSLKSALPADSTLPIGAILGLGALGTTLLMARFMISAIRETPRERHAIAPLLWTGWLLCLAGLIGILIWQSQGWFESFATKALWSAFWPVALGLVIVLMFIWKSKRLAAWVGYIRIPPGDILALIPQTTRATPDQNAEIHHHTAPSPVHHNTASRWLDYFHHGEIEYGRSAMTGVALVVMLGLLWLLG